MNRRIKVRERTPPPARSVHNDVENNQSTTTPENEEMNKPRKTPPKPGFVDRELRDDYYRQRYFERHELRNEAKDKDDKAAGKEGGAVTLQIPKSLSFIVIGVISVFTFFEWTLRTLVNALMVGTLAMIFAMLWSIWSA